MKKKESTFSSFIFADPRARTDLFRSYICTCYGVRCYEAIIDKNNLKESNKAKSELIPEAKGEFRNYDGKLVVVQKNKIYVTEASKAVNGSGVVVTVNSNSYGGTLTAMIGIDNKGKTLTLRYECSRYSWYRYKGSGPKAPWTYKDYRILEARLC